VASSEVTWLGRSVRAARPDRVAAFVPELGTTTVRRTEQAMAAVRRTGERGSGQMEVAARLLLRAEGLASSAIEGLRATAADVAVAEASSAESSAEDFAAGGDWNAAAWVADNLAVVDDALRHRGPLGAKRLFAWHRRLMRHADLDPRLIGAWRDRLGWVGGANPLVATHVAVPHGDIPALMEDLFTFIARRDLDAVTQAAVAHAQFETIHPFADGNGRLGRVIVGQILARRLGVPVPPPVSVQFARDVGGYQSGLTLFRQGDVESWVSWFADAVKAAASRSGMVLDAVAELQEKWRAETLGLRKDSAARRLLEMIPAHPVLSAQTAADLLEVSEQASRLALEELARRGVLSAARAAPHARGRPHHWWVADDLLALLGR